MVNTSCLIQTKIKNDKTETKGKNCQSTGRLNVKYLEVKKYPKVDIKVFQFRPILLVFFTLFQLFCPGLQTNFNILNLMMIVQFFCFEKKIPFLGKFSRKKLRLTV